MTVAVNSMNIELVFILTIIRCHVNGCLAMLGLFSLALISSVQISWMVSIILALAKPCLFR